MNHTDPNEPPAPANQPHPPAAKKGRRFYRRPWLILLAAIITGFGSFIGLRYIINSKTHESTDDAFIQADTVAIAPRVSGQVWSLHVRDNQQVPRGALLVEIDPRDYEAVVAQKRALLQSARANLESAKSNLELAQNRVATAEATNAQRQAEADAARAVAARAQSDLERARDLLNAKTISPQEFDAARATANSNTASFLAAQQQAAAARSSVQEAIDQLANARSAIENAEAQIKQATAELQAAELNLSYTKIVASTAGRVTHRTVDTGDYIQVGQNIMALVPNDVYVVANFKETQLPYMRPGQPVTIKVDAHPQNAYAGHVDSIQAGSGAAFSLLPPENAVGNFVKVVQRVPVKILFNDPPNTNHILGPGLSVAPSVTVRNFSVPDWVLIIAAIFIGILVAVIGLRRAASAGDETHEPHGSPSTA